MCATPSRLLADSPTILTSTSERLMVPRIPTRPGARGTRRGWRMRRARRARRRKSLIGSRRRIQMQTRERRGLQSEWKSLQFRRHRPRPVAGLRLRGQARRRPRQARRHRVRWTRCHRVRWTGPHRIQWTRRRLIRWIGSRPALGRANARLSTNARQVFPAPFSV